MLHGPSQATIGWYHLNALRRSGNFATVSRLPIQKWNTEGIGIIVTILSLLCPTALSSAPNDL